jgi:integrase
VRISLKTDDLAKARLLRDAYEEADDHLWASFLAEDDAAAAQERYLKAVRRAEAFGLRYRSAGDLAANATWQELSRRFEDLIDSRTPATREVATLGLLDEPVVTLNAALELYLDEIAAPSLTGKSAQQLRKWRVIPERAVRTFSEVVGVRAVNDITRDDAQKFWRFWLDRVAPKAPARPTHTASSGNRQLGALSKLYAEYYRHMGDPDRVNPFAGLAFTERKKRTRPPFPRDWIRDQVLKPGALDGLNEEARAILLAVIETGARPSEICNIGADCIFLDIEVPFIRIQPSEDPDSPRELKTEASVRDLPLVGLALEAFTQFPKGFPRYREREEAASALINKYLRQNKLVPSAAHTLYSFRHSFEDRMKEAGIGDEMRRILFGHRRDREAYGEGGSMAYRRDLLLKVALGAGKQTNAT